MHNQNDAASRLQYLNQALRKMPLRNEGISVVHDSVIDLLLKLSECPTGENGFNETQDDVVGTKLYCTREEAE